jgi:hypothetical protein
LFEDGNPSTTLRAVSRSVGLKAPPFYLCGCAKSPSCASIQVLAKVLSAVLEIVSNKADSVKPGSHGELWVFNLWLLAAGTLLSQGLMVHRKA